ncbi:MAG TPA: hypothetical protein PKY53_00370 [Clostridia bacterium]|nr:hypothetical protein [Clostridia bacterium]
MLNEILTQIIGAIVMNWMLFVTIQGVVIFRRFILNLWKKFAFFVAGTFNGICSSIAMVFSFIFIVAFVYAKEGSFFLSEYQVNHVFPAVSAVCLEFAEIIVLFFRYFFVKHTQVEESKTAKVEAVVERIKSSISVFRKPNLAMLQ